LQWANCDNYFNGSVNSQDYQQLRIGSTVIETKTSGADGADVIFNVAPSSTTTYNIKAVG
jgi:hypothetical protein